MSREAMKLALEALEYIRNIDTEVSSQIKYGNAAQIIEAALAEQPAHTSTYTCGVCGVSMQMEQQAQQEPEIEYCTNYHCAGDCGQPHNQKEMREFLATAPQPAQQKPVAKHYVDGGHLVYPKAKCSWVGLTHEDIVIILNNDYGGSRADCIRAAEARLKEKNT